jgi:hypothetical protein
VPEAGDDKNAARRSGEDARLIDAIQPAVARDVRAQRAEAGLIGAAKAIEAVAQRGIPSPDIAAMLERARALHERARAAAARGADYVMFDCLQQIERELVLAMGEDERRVLAEATAATLRASGTGAQGAVSDTLMRLAEVPSVAICRAMLRERHAHEQQMRLRLALVQRQLPRLTALLIGAVLFFSVWALVGGFEWIVRQDVDVTLAMLFTNAVLLGFFGGLVSVMFGFVSRRARGGDTELVASSAVLLARAFIGAALAVPIVLAFESGLLNLGEYSPAVPLALSFMAGFAERLFVRRLERAVP